MPYSEWISAVADRLLKLGVPIDEINEEVSDFPWFKERFDDEALAVVTADEYFHLLMTVGLDDLPEQTEPRVYDPQDPF